MRHKVINSLRLRIEIINIVIKINNQGKIKGIQIVLAPHRAPSKLTTFNKTITPTNVIKFSHV
jgi:uncharacterized protein YuzE